MPYRIKKEASYRKIQTVPEMEHIFCKNIQLIAGYLLKMTYFASKKCC